MSNKTILITGGAGYIGSHVTRQLSEAGESVVVLDDLSTGFRQAVLDSELIVGNTGDADCLERVFGKHDIDTVMHFAAHTIVPESVADPLKYYRNKLDMPLQEVKQFDRMQRQSREARERAVTQAGAQS